MAIPLNMIKQKGEKQVILMQGDNTLDEAVQNMKQKGFAENRAWLVVDLGGGHFKTEKFSHLVHLVQNLGGRAFHRKLCTLPISNASRVYPVNTPKTAGTITTELGQLGGGSLVITDKHKFAGLLTNPHMGGSGLSDTLSLSNLHGEFVNLSEDKRTNWIPSSGLPSCPHCQHQGLYEVNVTTFKYTCVKCHKEVK